MESIASFLPLEFMQLFYLFFTYNVAIKTGKNKWLYTFITLIPVIGSIFFTILIFTTICRLLDEVNELKRRLN